MGTRSLTVFLDGEKEICVMYRQFDGYPSGHGLELSKFLSGMEMVNGIRDNNKKIANGMGCLTAQVISHFKDGAGGIYIYPPKTRDVWEEYTYYISGKEGKEPTIKIMSGNDTVFNGSASDCVLLCKKEE